MRVWPLVGLGEAHHIDPPGGAPPVAAIMVGRHFVKQSITLPSIAGSPSDVSLRQDRDPAIVVDEKQFARFLLDGHPARNGSEPAMGDVRC